MTFGKTVEWKGEAIYSNIGVLLHALGELTGKEEGRAFVKKYAEFYDGDVVSAKIDIGYVAYHLPMPHRADVLRWCNAVHPFFGPVLEPTPEDSYRLGAANMKLMQDPTYVGHLLYTQPED